MTTPATTLTPTIVWGAADQANNWSAGYNFNSADKATATKWVAEATKFSCKKVHSVRKMAKTKRVPTTDCNALLGVATGACCFQVTGTGPTAPLTGGWDKQVAAVIDAVYPLSKAGTKYFCSTQEYLSKVQGWKSASGGNDDKSGDDKKGDDSKEGTKGDDTKDDDKKDGNDSDDDGVAGTVDASMKFANKGKSKSVLKGSTTTWTCSGAIALAMSGVSASAIISLL